MDSLAQLTAALADRYAVDREIGRGGMATVYLARDVRHNRKVALKVLNPELGAVLGVERFLSEIQVTANLQHPNLLPLFDSGEAGGLLFYVMPYIEGESLRATLQREKQLAVDDAVHIAGAIASALDYAHRHGVIHRDLKPENILMHDGQPLVADFGIALAVSNAGGNRITQTGLSLGTPHYMSPEQATGDREVDGRTDIYSLGALLYEMLVGEPPHDGKTSQAIIAKVLTDKPRSIRLARDTVPVYLEAAVNRALAKLPADRFHTAHEFADAISGKHAIAMNAPSVDARASGAPRETRPRMASVRAALPWAVAVAALLAAGASWRSARNAQSNTGVLRYAIALPANAALGTVGGNSIAISRDDRFVAYSAALGGGTRHVYLRSADELQAREIPGSDNAGFPFFSPDGNTVAFYANGQLLKAPVLGGRTEVVTEAPKFAGGTWSADGWIVVSNTDRLAKVPAAGGDAVEFTRLDSARGETAQLHPVVLADGKTVLYTSQAMGGGAGSRIGAASLADGSTTLLDVPGTFPLGVLDGYLIYSTAAGSLMAVKFDVAARRVGGSPIALADQAAVNATSIVTHASMATDGSLAYASGVTRRQFVVVAPDGSTRAVGDVGSYSWPRFSPDGKRIAVSVGSLTQRDVWLFDLPAGPFTRLTTTGAINDRPEWFADSKSVYFRSNRNGRNAIWTQPADGGGVPSLFFGRAESQIDEGVLSPDGAYLLVQRDSTGNGEVWYRAVRGDTTLRPVQGGSGAFGGRFSPDGKWIAYTSTESNIAQVYVRSFPSLENKAQVSLNGGSTPIWSADGTRIYYVNGEQLLVATVGSTQPFTIASRAVVLLRGFTFNNVHADYDIAKDSRTILALQSPSLDAQLVVVRNFAQELRTRARSTPR